MHLLHETLLENKAVDLRLSGRKPREWAGVSLPVYGDSICGRVHVCTLQDEAGRLYIGR